MNLVTAPTSPPEEKITSVAGRELHEQSPLRWIEHMANREANPAMANAACTELYRRFGQRLVAAAYKFTYLGPDFDPEGVVNDTFLRAFRSARKFQCRAEITDAF